MARLPAEAIWESVAGRLEGFTVEVLPELDSTNSELMRRARAGRCEPVLLVALRQTAGRGRLGRTWHSGHDDALTFSLGLPLAPADWSGLSLAVGVSLAESLHPRVALKWPNDLWVDGRKLGGILVETASAAGAPAASRYVVVGVGLNLAERSAEGLSTPPASLRGLDPQADPGSVLLRLVQPLVADLQRFERQGFDAFRARFEGRDLLCGRPVTLSDGTVGTARGVDVGGGLRVDTPDGPRVVTSAEVSVRPVA